MTRQGMRDWLNEQIRGGRMTLDESSPFMAMTMKVPVAGGGGELPAATDPERVDFVERIRVGIEGAQSRGDTRSVDRLEAALSTLSRAQHHIVRIDTRV